MDDGNRGEPFGPSPKGVIIDNGQAGYSDAGGGWLSWSGPGYYNGNARYAYAGSGASVLGGRTLADFRSFAPVSTVDCARCAKGLASRKAPPRHCDARTAFCR